MLLLVVSLEESHQVWELEGELVQVELELQGWHLDELLLLWLLVVAVLGNHAGNHGKEGKEDDDLWYIQGIDTC